MAANRSFSNMAEVYYRPHTSEPLTDLPEEDAMKMLLDKIPKDRLVQNNDHYDKDTAYLIPTRLPPALAKKKPRSAGNDSDNFALSLLHSQQQEIDNYKQALQRMGEEMVLLQSKLGQLESENSALRREMTMHENAAKALAESDTLEEFTKAELVEKYVTLRHTLSKQVTEAATYRDKVLQLQNQLIKHNDRERDLLKAQESKQSYASLLQVRNEKIKKLESACRQQEEALKKMEQLLKNKPKRIPAIADKSSNEMYVAVSAENASLKAQLARLQIETRQKFSPTEDANKMKIQLQLEKSELRVATLENELQEKARQWTKEKQTFRQQIGDDYREPQRFRSLPPVGRFHEPKPDYHDYHQDYYGGDYQLPAPRNSRLSPLY